MNLADVLHAMIEKVFGWGARPDLHDAVNQNLGAPPAPESEPPPESPQA